MQTWMQKELLAGSSFRILVPRREERVSKPMRSPSGTKHKQRRPNRFGSPQGVRFRQILDLLSLAVAVGL